jgi:DnaA regulatory inactivator Hda
MTEQMPLPLGHRTALGREDFLVAPSNEEAVAWLDRWPNWPAPALLLVGPSGSGKSHLAHVFASRAGAEVIDLQPGEVLDPPTVLDRVSALVIDDADRTVDDVTLFHLYNLAKERQASLLLTCSQPPSRWVELPDLRSRLMAAPLVSIGPPDDTVMGALLIKMFSDRQIKVSVEVISYLLRHMERSHAAARLVVEAADQRSLARQKPITVPLLRDLLASAEGPED